MTDRIYTPNKTVINGSDLTGSDATANRTYTISNDNILGSSINIIINGTPLIVDYDYSYSVGVITFLNIVDNTDVIEINYFTYSSTSTSSSSSLKYSTVLSLVKHVKLLGTIPNKDNQTKETVGTGDNSATQFWLDKLGVIEDTYTLYYGADATTTDTLTENTHYTIDLDTSEITLTDAGVTLVDTNNIYAVYKYSLGEVLNSDYVKALRFAENKLELYTEMVFADSTADNPRYRKIVGELKYGNYMPEGKIYQTFFSPLVKISTTTNGAYTTGGTEIILTDASYLPTTGTIYIGGNKVTYTDKSSNTLTIPSSTPSIADAATVVGEVIEISKEPEGQDPSYTVLEPDTDYQIDYLHGRIKILNSAYWGEIYAEDRLYPSNYLIRMNYFHAWHLKDLMPSIPGEIEEIVNMIAAKQIMKRNVNKAYINGFNDFNPKVIDVDDDEIDERLYYYKPLNVGDSMYDKQGLS